MDANKRLTAVEKEFFTTWVKRHPLLGTSLGFIDDYGEEVGDGSLHHEIEDQKFLRKILDELKAIDPKKLVPGQRVDHAFAQHLLELWLYEREELRLWERIPEAPRFVGLSLFQLLSRSTPPLNLRLRSIMKRLELLPKYIDDSRSKLRQPVKLFIEHELETLSRLPSFFNQIKSVSFDHLPPTPQRNLHRLIESVQNALQRYEDWLIIDVLPECRHDWPIGEESLRGLLARRGISESPATLLRHAEDEVERCRERLKDLSRTIKRKAMIEDIRDSFKQQHADNIDGVLRYVRDSVGKLKQFVNRSKFATLPDHEQLFVVETPTFLRHYYPLHLYQPHGKFETKDAKRDGYYFVTPGDCDSDKLKEHNVSSVAIRTVMGTYPGQHLYWCWAQRHPSMWRTFAASPETVDGWSSYVSERVRELGFDDSPSTRFMGLVDDLYRAGMTVLDVRLSTGRMIPKHAVEYLIDNVGMDRVAAEAEVARYVTQPGQHVSHFYGRERMKELRKHAKEEMRGRYSDHFFHTSVMQSGGLPPHLLKQELDVRIQDELNRPEEDEKEKKDKKGKKETAAAPAKKAAAPSKKKPAPKKKAKAAKRRPAPKARPKPKPRRKPKAKRKPAKKKGRR